MSVLKNVVCLLHVRVILLVILVTKEECGQWPKENIRYEVFVQIFAVFFNSRVFKIQITRVFKTFICTGCSVPAQWVPLLLESLTVITIHCIVITKTGNKGLKMWPLKFLLLDKTYFLLFCAITEPWPAFLSVFKSQPVLLLSHQNELANRKYVLLSDELLM